MARRRFGDRASFAIEVGELLAEENGSVPQDPSIRLVDVWAGGRWLTCDDNHVYVPHFAGMLSNEVSSLPKNLQGERLARPWPELSVADNFRRLRNEADSGDNRQYLAYRFMDWGPSADNVSALLFCEGGMAFIPLSFWRERHHDPAELGQVFVVELPALELVAVLHEAAWALIWGWSDRSGLS